MSLASPLILEHRWGSVDVQDLGTVRDAKVFPGGARAWDWRETGTQHVPGIQVADVLELVEAGATHVVLSEGVHRRLQVMPETLAWLAERGVEVIVLQTQAAVAAYNRHVEAGTAVAALIHSTC